MLEERQENKMYLATIELSFSYGHRLLNYKGLCHQLHGHNARVEVTVATEQLDAQGFVIDFSILKKVAKDCIAQTMDHRTFLQGSDPLYSAIKRIDPSVILVGWPPTAEHLAEYLLTTLQQEVLDPAEDIYKMLRASRPHVVEVKFWETDTSYVTVRRD
jgi:6-pyruvoyltetrahydropterin/6-carboxytetrahydropterin synthase